MGERLFAAVIPPADVIDELARWIGPHKDSAWRWMEASDGHVTLAFYADVDPWRYEELVDRLGTAAARTTEFATASWDVTEIALVQSVLGQGPQGGPRYGVREGLALMSASLR